MASDVTAQLDPVWKSVLPKATPGPPVIWGYRLSPAVPAEWPMTTKEGAVVRYAFGAAQDVSLRDGERVSAPFALVELAPDGSATVKQLTKSLEKIEVQGVRPITREAAEAQSGDLVEAARTGQSAALRKTWCAWKKNNGVAARHVVARHTAFFAALQCEARDAGP